MKKSKYDIDGKLPGGKRDNSSTKKNSKKTTTKRKSVKRIPIANKSKPIKLNTEVKFKKSFSISTSILVQTIRFKRHENLNCDKEIDLLLQIIDVDNWYEIRNTEIIKSFILDISNNPEKLPFYETTVLDEIHETVRKIAIARTLIYYFTLFVKSHSFNSGYLELNLFEIVDNKNENSKESINHYAQYQDLRLIDSMISKIIESNGKPKRDLEIKDLLDSYNYMFPLKRGDALKKLYKGVLINFKDFKNIKKENLLRICGVMAIHLGLIDINEIQSEIEKGNELIETIIRNAIRPTQDVLFHKKIINPEIFSDTYLRNE